MDPIGNNENRNPKSLGRIGFNTELKGNIQFKNNISVKNKKLIPRTPLKSKMNLINKNPQQENTKEDKALKYPLLKSISSSNINNDFNNDNINEEDDNYNKNAFKDEAEDYMHMNQDTIILNNNEENDGNFELVRPKLNDGILNEFNPFGNNGNNNYVLGAHFDEEGKKEYDDYFNSPDENDLNDYFNYRL